MTTTDNGEQPTKTPETDAQVSMMPADAPFNLCVTAAFARSLERQRDEARRELADLHGMYSSAVMELNREREAVADLTRQLQEVTTVLEAWQTSFGSSQLSHALAHVEADKQSLRRQSAALQEKHDLLKDAFDQAKATIAAQKERVGELEGALRANTEALAFMSGAFGHNLKPEHKERNQRAFIDARNALRFTSTT